MNKAYNTVEAIREWPMRNGWYVEPETGRRIRLGHGVSLGDGVSLGHYVGLGDGVSIGDYVSIGNGVRLPSIDVCGYTANPYAPGEIRIGCEHRSVGYWRQHLPEIMEEHGIDPAEEQAIRDAINWLARWFQLRPDAMRREEAEDD